MGPVCTGPFDGFIPPSSRFRRLGLECNDPSPNKSFFNEDLESVLNVVENGEAGVEPLLPPFADANPPSREAGGEIVTEGEADLRLEWEAEDEREALED